MTYIRLWLVLRGWGVKRGRMLYCVKWGDCRPVRFWELQWHLGIIFMTWSDRANNLNTSEELDFLLPYSLYVDYTPSAVYMWPCVHMPVLTVKVGTNHGLCIPFPTLKRIREKLWPQSKLDLNLNHGFLLC